MNANLNTYLFAWNPIKWPWPEISEVAELVANGGKYSDTWTCVSHKKVKPGDRAFFTKVGPVPRGLFASGYVTSEPFIGLNHRNTQSYRVTVEFDVLLDPAQTEILTLDILNVGPLSKQMWTPQSSGIIIKPEFTQELEALWQDFLQSR